MFYTSRLLVRTPLSGAQARQSWTRAMASAEGAQEVGSRKPIQVAGWTVDGVSVAGQVGGEVQLKAGYTVRPFQTVHVIPSQGYLVFQQRKKLRAEFQGAGRDAIIAAKKSGVDVNTTWEEPEIAFTGDTQIEFADLAGNSPVFRAKLLIMECTFVDDSVDVAQAKERGHTHILDLVKYAHKFQNERILLIHFSARHSPKMIEEQLDKLLPSSLREKVVPFLSGFALH